MTLVWEYTLVASRGLPAFGFWRPQRQWVRASLQCYPRSWGVHQSTPDSFLSVAMVCVMHESTSTLWGCLYSYSCHSSGQQALWMCLSEVSQAPFGHPHLPYVALTARRSKMQVKPWPGRSYFEGPNGTWMKKGSKPPETGRLRSCIWVLKAISASSAFVFINSSYLPSLFFHVIFPP